MNREQLIERGFVSLTEPYTMPAEDEMFSRAVRSLSLGRDPFFVLWGEDRETAELWTIPSHPEIAEDKL